MKTKNFFPTGQSQENQESWHRLFELIESGHYDQASEVLDEDQEIKPCHNSDLSYVLSAIRQICAACNQFRREADQHKQAGEEATKKENDLKQQLHALIVLTRASKATLTKSQGAASAPCHFPSDRVPDETEQPSRVWKRIQTLFKQHTENGPRKTPKQDEPMPTPLIELAPSRESSAADLAVYCFGPFRVYCIDQLVTPWNSQKSLAVFKYLVKHHGSPVSKEVLMDTFWSDAGVEAARRNLHQAVYSLRQTLRRGAANLHPIQFENDCYFLNPSLKIWIDCVEFEKRVQAGRQLEKSGNLAEAALEFSAAESLYRGDFFEEDPYEEWTGPAREKYRNAYLDLADHLSEYFQKQGNYQAAIEICHNILARDNCHEKSHRRLMQCYQSRGERQRALRQYQSCAEVLKQELDESPSPETQILFEKIVGGGGNLNPN